MSDLLYATLLAVCGLTVLALLARRRRTSPGARRGLRTLLPVWILLLAYLPLEAWCVLGLDTTDAFAVTRLTQRWIDRHGGPVNGLGLRDWEHSPGAVDVVVLGDSFAWGYGVPELQDRVGGQLARRLGLQVATCAVPGNDTRAQLELLEAWLARYGRPRLVVQAYVFNDAPPGPDEPRGDGQPVFPVPPPPLSWVLAHSLSLDLLYHRAWGLTDRVQRMATQNAARYTGDLTAHEADLARLHARIEAAGAAHLLVGWPFHEPGDRYAQAYDWLGSTADRRGIPYLDLRPAFAGREPDSLTVGRLDTHPNAEAHALAAEAIAAWIAADPARLPPRSSR